MTTVMTMYDSNDNLDITWRLTAAYICQNLQMAERLISLTVFQVFPNSLLNLQQHAARLHYTQTDCQCTILRT